MDRKALRWRALPSLSWWLCTQGDPSFIPPFIPWAPESAGRCSRSRRISCAPGLAFPACPLRSFFVCFVTVVVVFSEKHDEKPAWEAGATRASLSEKGSRQSLTSSYTRVSLTSSSPSYSLHTHRVLEVPSH